MKKYFAITCIVLSASSVFFFAQAQNSPQDAVKAAQERYLNESRKTTEVLIARAAQLKEEEYKKIAASGQYTTDQLAVIKNVIDVGTAAGLVVIFNEGSATCVRISEGVAKCDVTPEGGRALGEMIHSVALAAVARGNTNIERIKADAAAFAAKTIAADQAKLFTKTVNDALGQVQKGERILQSGINGARTQLWLTGGLVNSFLNVFNIGKDKWNAGNAVLPVGEEALRALREIEGWTADINNLLASAEAGIRNGTFGEDDLKSTMREVQRLLLRIQNNANLIMSYVYKDKAARELTDTMRNLAATNRDAAAALRTYGPLLVSSVGSIDDAVKKMKSPETQAQLKALATHLENTVNPSIPLEKQIPELNPGLPPAGTGNSAPSAPVKPPRPANAGGVAPMPPPPMMQPTTLIDSRTRQPAWFVLLPAGGVQPILPNSVNPAFYNLTKTVVDGNEVWALVPKK